MKLHCPDCLFDRKRLVSLEEVATWAHGPSSLGGAQYVHACPECNYEDEYSDARAEAR